MSITLSEDDIAKLTAWNQTDCNYPDLTLVQLLEQQLEKTPDAIAVSYEEECLTYLELHQKANQWAHFLREKGVNRNVIVAVCLPRCLELVVALLAVLKAGGAYLPIDVKQPMQRIRVMLENSGTNVFITHEECLLSLQEPPLQIELLTPAIINRQAASCITAPLLNQNVPEDLSYVIYTSGSTGVPKGVANVQRGTVNRLVWMQEKFQLTENDRVLQKTSLSFDVAVWEFWWPLISGARLVLATENAESNADVLAENIISNTITVMHFVPSQLDAFLATKKLAQCESLRYVIASGELLSSANCNAFFKQSKAFLFNLYGPTEASIDVSFYHCQPIHPSASMPIGKPIANTQLFVLDDNQKKQPIGYIGELVIAGHGLAREYWHDSVLTQQKFIEIDSYEGNKIRAYRTGDLARWSVDGNLEFMGRLDEQIKIRGFRIEPKEIEAAILKNPAVNQALITLKNLPTGQKVLVAYLVKNKSFSLESKNEALTIFLQAQLPEYMIPHHWVWLDNFSLTLSGKIDKKALPDPQWSQSDKKLQLPKNSIEQQLVEVWQQVLKTNPISITDNFYSLGGDSLSAMMIAAQAEQKGLFFRSQSVMLNSTIELLAQYISTQQKKLIPSVDDKKNEGFLTHPLYQKKVAAILHQEEGIELSRIKGVYPATPIQQGMLFHTLQVPHQGMYLNQIGLDLYGLVNEEKIFESWRIILTRHDCLRTGFYLTEFDLPQQVIFCDCMLRYERQDLSSYLDEVQKLRITDYIEKIRHEGFDFKHPPLWEIVLFRLAENHYRMIYTDHHAISDGMTQGILFKEFFQIYNDIEKNASQLLTHIPYVDYLEWLSLQDKTAAKSYWKNILKSVTTPTTLGIDRLSYTRRDLKSFYKHKIFSMPGGLLQSLHKACKTEKVTLNTIIQTAWSLLLARYSEEDPVIYGLIESGRQIDLDKMTERTGVFLESFPVVIGFDEGLKVSQLLKILQTQIIESSHYSYYSLNEIKEVSQLSSETPLFHYAITFVNYNAASVVLDYSDLCEVQFSNFFQESITHYPLSVMVMPNNNSVEFYFSYDCHRFNEEALQCFFVHWQRLLQSMVGNMESIAIRLPMLTEKEEHQLLYEWNNTFFEYPKDKTVIQLFEEQVKKTPNNTALIFEGAQITYQELNHQANQLAHYLRAKKTKEEIIVAIYLDRGIDFIICMLGVLKAGGAYVPIDAHTPLARVNYMLKNCEAKILITEKEKISNTVMDDCFLCFFSNEKKRTLHNSFPKENLSLKRNSQHLAYVMYTSGSTGAPKGVMIEEKSLMNCLMSFKEYLKITEEDSWLALTSLAFDISALEIYLPLLVGGKVVLASETEKMDPSALQELAHKWDVTIIQATPQVWSILAEFSWHKPLKMICGGEKLGGELAAKLNKVASFVWNGYGPTETTIYSTLYAIDGHPIDNNSSPIGKPLKNTQAYVLDKGQQLSAIGAIGELFIGGEGLARGYINQPSATKEKFILSPFHNDLQQILYRTGDLVRWLPTGDLEYIDRRDEQIKLRGFRIELGEIESVILQHPGISQAKVILQKSELCEKNIHQLVAYLIADADYFLLSTNNDQLYDWQRVYEATYSYERKEKPQFNLSGWMNSFTQQPYSDAEMREWKDAIVKRITQFHPTSILEIGCGTGLLLFALGESCEHYLATDFSLQAIQYIQSQLKSLPWRSKIQCQHVAAHQLVSEKQYDTVILNSVIQYFSNPNYLKTILNKAISFTQAGGQIILGDVRNLSQLPLFYTALTLHQASNEMTLYALQSKIFQLQQQEKELALDPAFFYSLANELPCISAAEIQLKRGRYPTEMNQFRYDVILHIEKDIPNLESFSWLVWQEEFKCIQELHKYITVHQPKILALKAIPHVAIVDLSTLLEHNNSNHTTCASFKKSIRCKSMKAIFPEEIATYAEQQNYCIYLTPGENPETFNAILYIEKDFSPAMLARELTLQFIPCYPLTDYINNPERKRISDQIVKQLYQTLKQSLPVYMHPSYFIWLERLPLTANGKLDKGALPCPETEGHHRLLVKPRNTTEAKLLTLWQALLSKNSLSVLDNFFAIGGHSLLAMQLLAQIRLEFNVHLSIHDFYQAMTVEDLSILINSERRIHKSVEKNVTSQLEKIR